MENLLISGGTIWKKNRFVRGEALLLTGEIIAASGPEAAVRASSPRGCPEIRLAGEAVLPGVTDGHIHLTTWAKQKTLLDLSAARSLQDVLRMVKKESASLPPDRWIRGWNYNDSSWPEGRSVTKGDLDSLSIPNPVLLQRVCTHVNVGDSKALFLSGTESSDGILREREGIPVLHAMERNVFSRRSLKRALKEACFHLASQGVTSIHPCGADDYGMEEDLSLYMDLHQEGGLPLRIFSYHDRLPHPWLPTGFGDGWIHYQGLKIYLDGSLGGRTAALSAPYSDDVYEDGCLNWTDGEILEKLRSARERGIQTMLHAIGDRALDQGLRCLEQVDGEFGIPRLRDRINHVMVCRPDQRRRLASLKLFCDIQPAFVPSDMNMAEYRLGSDRLAWAYRWRALWREGLLLSASSDAPVESVNPWHSLWALTERSDPEGSRVFAPEERMTVEEALPFFTSNPPLAAGQGHRLGTLEPGFAADMIVLDRDISSSMGEDLKGTEVRWTFAGGKLSRGDFPGWPRFEAGNASEGCGS